MSNEESQQAAARIQASFTADERAKLANERLGLENADRLHPHEKARLAELRLMLDGPEKSFEERQREGWAMKRKLGLIP